MSWSELEYSVANGLPLTLYEFSRENRIYWRYTNADQSLTIDNKIYTAAAVSDSGYAVGGDDSLTITAPTDNPVVMLYRGVPPSGHVMIRIYRMHYNDNAQELRVVWVGTINEVRRLSTEQAEVITSSLASSFNRLGLRLTWGRACPYAVYDAQTCRAKKAIFVISGLTISRMDGASITLNLPAQTPQGWLNAGFIEWDSGGITERRHISTQVNNVVTILGGTYGLTVGLAISAYPGCSRDINTCSSKFNNHINFGGVPQMPGKSPFDGTRIF